MSRLLLALAIVLGLMPSPCVAVDIKNIRPCYAPFGATRFEARCLPGDVLFLTYDIEDLALEAKTGKASYVTILELLEVVDPLDQKKDKVIFKKETENDVIPQLGGARMPGDLHVIMGPKQAPGNYAVKLTVHDKIGKDAKAFRYPFVVEPERFGFVGVSAPAVGFPGQHYVTGFALVNLGLDAKKQPNVEVTIKVYDGKKNAVAQPVKMLMPRDMPENADLEKANFVPLTYPIYLNRVGRYTIEVIAQDKISNKTAELRFPVTVIDVNEFTNK